MKKEAIKGTIGFFFYILFMYSQTLPLQLMGIDYNILSVKQREIYLIMYCLFAMIVLFLLFRKELIDKLKDFFKDKKNFFKKYINYWFIILGIMIISNMIIVSISGNIANNESNIRETFQIAPVYTLFAACLFAPFTEEIIFRLCLSKIFLNKKLFIILSGILFGALHVVSSYTNYLDLLYIIPYGAPGFIFAYLLTKTDNIFNTISIHFIHNTFLMLLQLVLLLSGLL